MEQNLEFSRTLTEVDTILNYVDKELYEKIPEKILNFIKTNKDDSYIFKYDAKEKIQNQNLKEETASFLSYLFITYCITKEEREKIINECIANDKKYEDAIREKYNPDNIFKNTSKESKNEENVEKAENTKTDLIEIKKKNIFNSIFEKIKNILKKIRR